MNNIDVGPYNPFTDIIVIEGTKYSGALFRALGCNFPAEVGQVFRVEKKEDGQVWLRLLRSDKLYKNITHHDVEEFYREEE